MTQVDPKEEKSRVPIHQFQSVCIYFLFWSFIIVIKIIFSAVTGLHLTQVSCMFIFSFSFAYALMTHAHVILPKWTDGSLCDYVVNKCVSLRVLQKMCRLKRLIDFLFRWIANCKDTGRFS